MNKLIRILLLLPVFVYLGLGWYTFLFRHPTKDTGLAIIIMSMYTMSGVAVVLLMWHLQGNQDE